MKKISPYILAFSFILAGVFTLHAQSSLFIETAGRSTDIHWHGETNLSYDIEYALNLTDNSWTNSGVSHIGSNANIRVALTNIMESPLQPKAFFRLTMQYPANESRQYQDMLTPLYYNSATGAPFRTEMDRFIYYSQTESFHHPLKNSLGQIPPFEVSSRGMFGADKGRPDPVQYHPAVDISVESGETNVNLFAVYAGYVTTYKDADKYRQYLAISNNVVASNGDILGKIVTVYAHIDLDLDEAESLLMSGQYVNKGDLVSKHLYLYTTGGPHLHFEIRYYKPGDNTDTEFYGLPINPEYTEESAGPWTLGKWDPNTGYGFGDPKNHGLTFY